MHTAPVTALDEPSSSPCWPPPSPPSSCGAAECHSRGRPARVLPRTSTAAPQRDGGWFVWPVTMQTCVAGALTNPPAFAWQGRGFFQTSHASLQLGSHFASCEHRCCRERHGDCGAPHRNSALTRQPKPACRGELAPPAQ
jgi:hypothetical protein